MRNLALKTSNGALHPKTPYSEHRNAEDPSAPQTHPTSPPPPPRLSPPHPGGPRPPTPAATEILNAKHLKVPGRWALVFSAQTEPSETQEDSGGRGGGELKGCPVVLLQSFRAVFMLMISMYML